VVSVVYLDCGCRTLGSVLFVKKERMKREKKRVEIRQSFGFGGREGEDTKANESDPE